MVFIPPSLSELHISLILPHFYRMINPVIRVSQKEPGGTVPLPQALHEGKSKLKERIFPLRWGGREEGAYRGTYFWENTIMKLISALQLSFRY